MKLLPTVDTRSISPALHYVSIGYVLQKICLMFFLHFLTYRDRRIVNISVVSFAKSLSPILASFIGPEKKSSNEFLKGVFHLTRMAQEQHVLIFSYFHQAC
jgi:hypothetical protein